MRAARRRTCAERFFAGDVDRRRRLARIGGERLQDQRGLADARIAAEQQRRARHQSAAGDAVELGDAGHAARRFLGLARESLRARTAGPSRSRRAGCARRRRGLLLDERVPGAAIVAVARPFRMRRAAGLADIGVLRARHLQPRTVTAECSAPHLHLDRAFGGAVDELIDIGIAAVSMSLVGPSQMILPL